MDKQEHTSELRNCTLRAIDALHELKDISIAYNADFEGEGTFVRVDKKKFDQLVDGINSLIWDLGFDVLYEEK